MSAIPRPNKLRIGHLDYDVKWVGDDWMLQTDRSGEISYVKQEMTIAETLRPEKMADTFLHEIMHAIHSHYDRCNTEPIALELAAERTAAGLIMVWRANPDAFRWWAELVESVL